MLGISRRQFIAMFGCAVPAAAHAQPDGRGRRLGVLMGTSESDAIGQLRRTALEQSLDKLGWTIGRNLQIDYRWGSGDIETIRNGALDILGLDPDAIVVNPVQGLAVLQRATRRIPIVFVVVSEPVAQGFVSSLARPGGNITGFTNLEPTMGGKWLGLLKEMVPETTRVAVMSNPVTTPFMAPFHGSAEAAASALGLRVVSASVRDRTEIEPAMVQLAREPGGGLILPGDTFNTANRKLIVDLAERHRLPAIYSQRDFSDVGGLMSYGIDQSDTYRRAAAYVDRIFRGEKPADLPVQQPVKFELVINLKTAKALGLTVPLTLLGRADGLIE